MAGFPVSNFDINWLGPFDAFDIMNPESEVARENDHAGIYIQQLINASGNLVTTYLGKSETSVSYRQSQHFMSYDQGIYDLYDANGSITFRSYSAKPTNFDQLLVDHLNLMHVFVGKISKNSCSDSTIVSAVEALLLQSPTWNSQSPRTRILNKSKGKTDYAFWQDLTLQHIAPPEVITALGGKTNWNRTTKCIT